MVSGSPLPARVFWCQGIKQSPGQRDDCLGQCSGMTPGAARVFGVARLPRLGQSRRPRSPIRSRNGTHLGSRNWSLLGDCRCARRPDRSSWLRSYAEHGGHDPGEPEWRPHRNMGRDTQRFGRWEDPPRTNPDRCERTRERRTLEGQPDMSWQLDPGQRLRRLPPLSSPSGFRRLLSRRRYRLPDAHWRQPVRLSHPTCGRLCAQRHPASCSEQLNLTPVPALAT